MSDELVAEMGCYVISNKPNVLMCVALGSCVGVSMFDVNTGFGGMAHVMLPNAPESNTDINNNKFANIAIPNMLKDLKNKGVNIQNLKIKIAGGAHMFKSMDTKMEDIGKKNSTSVKEILKSMNLNIGSEELGGSIGRTVRLYLDSGKFEIKTKDGIKEI